MSRKDWLPVLGLLLLVTGIYGQSASFGFVGYDDPRYISANPYIASGLTLDSFLWALTNLDQGSVWSPVLWWSYAADISLFGLNPGAMHIEQTLLLHGLASVFTYFLVLQLSNGQRGIAFLAAALWCVAGLNVESVAWLSEKKNTLSQVFALAAMLAHVRFARNRAAGAYLATVLLGTLAMLTKSATVVLPVLLLAMGSLLHARRDYRRMVAEQIPLLLIALVTGLLTIKAELTSDSISLPGSVTWALQSLLTYLQQTVWPVNLYAYYRCEVESIWSALGGASCLGVMLWLVWHQRIRAPLVSFGLVWFLVALSLVIGFPRWVGNSPHADRLVYFALAGLMIAVAALAARYRRGLVVLALTIIPMAALSHVQARHWASAQALEAHAAEGNPYAPPAVSYLTRFLPPTDAIVYIKGAIALDDARTPRDVTNMPSEMDRVALRWMLAGWYVTAGLPDEARQAYRALAASQPADTSMYRDFALPVMRQLGLETEVAAELVRLGPARHPLH